MYPYGSPFSVEAISVAFWPATGGDYGSSHRLQRLYFSLMRPVADVIVRRLRDAGVITLFGIPGGGSNLDLVDAARRTGLPFVLTATETGAALAALAQAEISGVPGACLTTLGPGAASVVNGVACAYLDRVPLLVFTDKYPAAAAG